MGKSGTDKLAKAAEWVPAAISLAASACTVLGYVGLKPDAVSEDVYPLLHAALFAASVASAFALGFAAKGVFERRSKRRTLHNLHPKLRQAMLEALNAEGEAPIGEYDSLVEISIRQGQGAFILIGYELYGHRQSTAYTLTEEWFGFLSKPWNRKLLESLVRDRGDHAADQPLDAV